MSKIYNIDINDDKYICNDLQELEEELLISDNDDSDTDFNYSDSE